MGQVERLTERVVDAHSPCHALLSLDGREDFGGVLECDWALSEGVADGEEVDESNHVSVSEETIRVR